MIRLLPALSLALTLLAAPALAVPPDAQAKPDEAKAADATAAMAGFKKPEGMTVKLWAAEPLLAGPVAFDVDFDGRVYVAETERFGKGVGDNRAHEYWLLDDLAADTIADRQAYYDKWIAKGNKTPQWFTEHADQLRVVYDTDGDGKADRSHVLATFNEPLDGIGSGVLAHRGDIYYTNIPHLWKLRDADNDGEPEVREKMSTGYGVRSALLGHDLHGLVWGPDGKLYFSVGDRGFNIKTDDGRTLVDPMDVGRGAVFRCNPDGSELEVFAWGLRNPQELAFDDYGNLWTGDNNSDAGDAARLVYVVEQGDTGWAMSFQTLEGSYRRGPWNQEKLWHTRHDGQPAWHIPPVAHITSGPSGLVAYPGLGLPEKYNGYFFLCDFRANTGNSGIVAFTVEPDGAGFQMKDAHQFWWHIVATDVDFGYDGRIYATDWVSGWSPHGQGRIYTLEDDDAIKDPRVAETAKLVRDGFDKQPTDKLVDLLAHPDRRVRLQAQFELAQRKATDAFEAVIRDENAPLLKRIHAIWGYGQVPDSDSKLLCWLLSSGEPEIAAQAARVMGDRGEGHSYLHTLIEKGAPRAQYHAAMALGKMGHDAKSTVRAVKTLVDLLRANDDKDVYLRHAAVTALWRIGDADAVLKYADDESSAVRLGVLLTLRKMRDARIARFLDDADGFLVVEAARAIYDLQIPGATDQLADMLAQLTGGVTDAEEPAGGSRVTEAEFTATFSDKPDAPVKLSALTFTDRADNYTTTIVGSFVAPASGDYVFRIAGDDYADLMLSTDDKPANLRSIAKVPNWTDRYEFTKFAEQTSKPIALEAGRRYAVRVEHREGGGNDYATVVYTGPDGIERVLGGSTVPAAPSAADAQTEYALHRRVISAAFRRGTPADVRRLAAYAADASNPLLMRQEALFELSDYAEPYPRERVMGFYRPLPKRDPAVVATQAQPHLKALLDGDLNADATALASKYHIALDAGAMLKQVADAGAPLAGRVASLRALHAQKADRLDSALDAALKSDQPLLRAEARDLIAQDDPDKAVALIDLASKAGSAPEMQRAFATLAALGTETADARLARFVDRMTAGQLDPAVELDLIEAAKARSAQAPAVKAALSKYTASLDASDPLAPHRVALHGGDAEKGRAVYLAHAAAQCQRCHKIGGEGGEAGPDLTTIAATRDPQYLLRALVTPQAEVAEGYGTVAYTLKDGSVYAGIIREQTPDKLTLLTPDNKTVTIDADKIANRTPPISAMPPMGAILTPRELRDVLAYLQSLK